MVRTVVNLTDFGSLSGAQLAGAVVRPDYLARATVPIADPAEALTEGLGANSATVPGQAWLAFATGVSAGQRLGVAAPVGDGVRGG
jgi:hypothetical protein